MIGVQFNAGRSRTAIREAIHRMENMTPLFEDIGEYLIEAHRQRFAQGVDPQGRPWAPKSATTLERYKQLGYGTLSKPLIGASKRLSREIQKIVSRDAVIVGSSLIYSRVMQDGAAKGEFGADRRGRPIPWGRIPARVWLGLSTADETAIVETVEDYIGPLDAQG